LIPQYYYYHYYYQILYFPASAGKHSPILGYVINRIKLDGLIYGLKSFLQLNMFQELQIFAFVYMYKACPSESGPAVGAPLFPAVELCDFPGRWQCMSGEIWYTLDSGSVLLTEAEGR
jgi:hypothetical protein